MTERSKEQLREHYEIEKGLADRLRAAGKDERRALYAVVYSERAERIPHHPLVVRAKDKKAQATDSLRQLRLLKPFLYPGMVFLELGAGDCALAIRAAQYVKQVYAVDVTSSLLLDQNLPPNFELRLFNGFELPVLNSEVDLIYSRDVVEHLHPDDVADQMSSAYRALRQGGQYICATPSRLSGPWDVSRNFDRVPTGFHLREYTNYELAEVFRAAGFADVRYLLSYHGYHLTPLMPLGSLVLFERLLERLPWRITHTAANLLVAVKVVATK